MNPTQLSTALILSASLFTLIVPALPAAEEAKPETPAEVSIFPDKNLEDAVRVHVFEKRNTDQPITNKDVENISTIKAKKKGIQDLTGLEKCRSLASLDLEDNQVSNLAPIAGLPRLQFLHLAGNKIADVAPLATDHALQYLELSRNQVKDVSALAGLTNMASLYLSDNQITDIGPVVHYPRLSSLYLDNNQIKSLEGIQQLKRLWTLSLSGNQIEDIAPLEGLTGLYYLFLEENQIKDLKPLVKMAEQDAGREFFPFLRLYLKGNPLGAGAREGQISILKKAGARVDF